MGFGMSCLIGVTALAWFSTFAYLRSFDFRVLSIPFLYMSLISALVSVASSRYVNLPSMLAKSRDGSFPTWSLILFGPYLFFVRGFSVLRRLFSGEDTFSEVLEGLYVGGWPSSADKMPPGDPAVVDCTCEFPRISGLSRGGYLCVPTWDKRSPRPSEIESAVKWACRKRELNVPVFVHCGYGHGRSVAVTCALLVALGEAENWKDAEKLIRQKRPYVRMNSLHREALEEWSKHRLSPLKNN